MIADVFDNIMRRSRRMDAPAERDPLSGVAPCAGRLRPAGPGQCEPQCNGGPPLRGSRCRVPGPAHVRCDESLASGERMIRCGLTDCRSSSLSSWRYSKAGVSRSHCRTGPGLRRSAETPAAALMIVELDRRADAYATAPPSPESGAAGIHRWRLPCAYSESNLQAASISN
jgi:hypothetical protein